jgi:hypothetical protein
MFVEVVNPGGRALKLSRLEYSLTAASWQATDGEVTLQREIGPGSSAIVEIPVPAENLASAAGSQAYRLEGRLYAGSDALEQSWDVFANGALEARRARAGGGPIHVLVASRRAAH